jgi:transcriptional regulator with XRE-family HTH domain
MAFSDRLKNIREEKELSIGALAKKAGLSDPYVRQLEKGIKKNPTGAVLKKFATALGVTIADLLGSPIGIPEKTLNQTTPSLREFARKKRKALDLRQEDIEMLSGIHYRGSQPDTVEDWELIHRFLKRLLDQ